MVNIVTIIYRVSYVSSDVGFQPSTVGVAFKYFFFSPLPGEMIQVDSYFSDGLKPPTRKEQQKTVANTSAIQTRHRCPMNLSKKIRHLDATVGAVWQLGSVRGQGVAVFENVENSGANCYSIHFASIFLIFYC